MRDFIYSLRIPKDTPKIAGTMMNTKRRVHHTVKEMPKSIQIRLSKGKRQDSILTKTWRPDYLNVTKLPKHRLLDSSKVPQFLKPSLKHGLHGHIGKIIIYAWNNGQISIKLTQQTYQRDTSRLNKPCIYNPSCFYSLLGRILCFKRSHINPLPFL